MRVLYHFRTRATGAEAVHIAGISRAFERLGGKVTFSSPGNTNPIASAGSNPFGSGQRKGLINRMAGLTPGVFFEFLELAYNLPAWMKNRRLLKSLQPDIVYERHAFFLFSTALLLRGKSVKYVVEVNELVGDQRVRGQPMLSALARWSDRRVFRRADLIVVVSSHLKQRIVEMGVAPSRILVLPNAVDEDDFRDLAQGSEVRSNLAIKPGDLVFGFIGWFVPWHQLDEMIRCFSQLLQTCPDSWLMMVGAGDLKADLVALAAQLGIADRLLWTGAVPHVRIPEHIAAMDVCVVPASNAYRSPIKLFEYMGQAKPVLAPNLEPIRQVLTSGRHGLTFSNGDFAQLTAAMQQLAEDEALRTACGEQARQHVLSHHTWTHNARHVLDAIGIQAPGQAALPEQRNANAAKETVGPALRQTES